MTSSGHGECGTWDPADHGTGQDQGGRTLGGVVWEVSTWAWPWEGQDSGVHPLRGLGPQIQKAGSWDSPGT